MKTGVIVPAYNEHESIASLMADLRKYVPDSLIVVVDDSPDERTSQALAPFVNATTFIIRRTKKGGRGSAVIAGIQALVEKGCDYIVEMDADFSHPPSQIPELLKKIVADGSDLLIASRYLPSSRIENWPLSRKIFSFLSNRVAKLALRVPISDYTNGFRVYSRRGAQMIVQSCGKLGTGFIALSEILVNLYYRGFKVTETPTLFVNRVRGESSLNSSEIRNALAGLYRIYILKRHLQRNKHEQLATSAH